MSRRRIVTIDDNHPDIRYEGSWELDNQEYEGIFTFGNYGGTQHRTSGQGSISYTFEGNGAGFFGTKLNGNDTIGNTSWQCIIDGQAISPPWNMGTIQNDYAYCSGGHLEFATHTLTINVRATESAPIWLDRIEISPSDNTADHATLALSSYSVVVMANDTSLRYGPGWQFGPDNFSKFTNIPSSFLELEFIGTQVIWRGIAIPNQPNSQSRATYILDDGPPTEFTILPRAQSYGQYILFETEKLPRNRHRLKVVYEGFEAPLLLNYLYIKDGDIFDRDPRTLGPDLDGLRIDAITGDGSTSKPSIGVIVGGVIGGVAFFFLIGVLGTWFLRIRRQRRERVELTFHIDTPPFTAGSPADVAGAQLYPNEAFNPYDGHGTNPPMTQPLNGAISHYTGPHTSYAHQSLPIAAHTSVSPKAQLTNAHPSPGPAYFEDSGIRFSDQNVAPPVYTND
ncbi:hypothetical protein FA15DRAFT_698398 [Coprinopsis marcescibilis]|uniref:Uncharacterized protein n=1 Tax=Coprinopsis marcescibilis TaxID=230819 RepID=A0A5C3KCD2_COPMA|nr:hypothetical protein FA15DRAFT_698398 [Coprinopsis marcescibilis]